MLLQENDVTTFSLREEATEVTKGHSPNMKYLKQHNQAKSEGYAQGVENFK